MPCLEIEEETINSCIIKAKKFIHKLNLNDEKFL